ncbi:hypothetical protein [Burkholderia contaminans]|uniref:hypothetical protein n=1 Tax=Burkholderia contaminans TaxID=488447 RepID=UPI000F57BBD1|nr:hypothetical protein [Burkholderia contaminans]RQT02078.1 hypothetical protein DF035_15295 [Burkholderia contaminans]
MPLPVLDLSQPDNVRRELLDDDRPVREEFAAALDQELSELAEALAACFARLPEVHAGAARAPTPRNELVAAFVFGVLDDVVVSTKLLLAGKAAAAGNVMRQAIEGIAMSAMCATDELLVIARNKQQGAIRARYWEKVWNDDSRVQGGRAVEQLDWNAGALRFAPGAVETLRQAKKHYNAFSHCGKATIAGRIALEVPGLFYVGGHFDPAKLVAYRAELTERTRLCRVLPDFMTHLATTMTPVAGAPYPPAPA